MANLRRDNGVTPVGSDRFIESRSRSGSVLCSSKRTDAKIVLQFAEMLPTGFPSVAVGVENLTRDAKLIGDEGKDSLWRNFLSAKHPAGEPKISEMHGEADPVRVPPPASD